MQSNRLILWSSFVALTLCAVPYGCAGKSIGSGDASHQEGTNSVTDGAYPGGDGSGDGDAAYQGAEGTVVHYGDGGINRCNTPYADGGCGDYPGRFPQGDGVGPQGDGYAPADGWDDNAPDYADGAPDYADGWDEHGDGQAPARADGNADGWPG